MPPRARSPRMTKPLPAEQVFAELQAQRQVPVMRHCPQCGILIESGTGEYGLAHHEHRSIPAFDEGMSVDKAEKVLMTLLLQRAGETKSVESAAQALSAVARLRMAKRPTRPVGRPPSKQRKGGDDEEELEALSQIVTRAVR